MRHRDDSLIGQVVAANVVLVTLTLIAASTVGRLDSSGDEWQLLVLALVIVLTFCVNLWMLQRRFGPLEHLIERVERIDPSEPSTFEIAGDPVAVFAKKVSKLTIPQIVVPAAKSSGYSVSAAIVM